MLTHLWTSVCFGMVRLLFLLAGALLGLTVTPAASAWTSDNGNGTFTNPVLNGDYPDPDIIRVGTDFYLATTTFVSVPGLEILHSKDLIHWEIVGYALPTLDFNASYNLIGGSAYAQGVWAPSLRYHDGTFYIIDNIQNLGAVVLRAPHPAGPWMMNRLGTGLFDPGLMFDDDGTPLVYNGTGGHISVAVLDPALRRVISNTPAYDLPHHGGEGSHAYKFHGRYYVFNAVYAMNATIACSRSQNRSGPFTSTTVCANQMPWHAPHQGGIVQLPSGDWWGFSLADTGPVGRTLWVGPVTWKDGWPYFGDPNAPAFPVTSPKPKTGPFPAALPSSDDFSGPTLALQWQWNHDPDDTKWSLSARRGYLRLKTQTAPNLTGARNTLTQRTEGPLCTGVVKMDISHLQPGDRAGLCLLEQNFGYLAVYKERGGQRIVRVVNKNGKLEAPSEDITDTAPVVPGSTLWLQARCDFISNLAQFSYSTDGRNFTPLGGDFPMHFTLATFQGERFGIFDYNPAGSSGWLDVDYFHEQEAARLSAADASARVT